MCRVFSTSEGILHVQSCLTVTVPVTGSNGQHGLSVTPNSGITGTLSLAGSESPRLILTSGQNGNF